MLNGIFGTDGVRGRANCYPMTPDVAMKLAQATAIELRRKDSPARVLIGRDTRLSGHMLETAMIAGFTSVGMEVLQVGTLPTPAVAMLTRMMHASLGVMISASHNPYLDNGIKLIGPDGYKLSDATERAISARMRKPVDLVSPEAIGCLHRFEDAARVYENEIRRTFPRSLSLLGLKIVVDAANGAAYKCAVGVLSSLGADVVAIGCNPDGLNINAGCGSTHPKSCQEAVVLCGADVGIALDGDADRVIMIDEQGKVIDGDQMLALIADQMLARGSLRKPCLVATVMSNMALERYLADRGVELLRAKVGDRHVIEMMRDRGCNLGGEQSGHIILADHATTGDGLLAALQVLAGIVASGRPASEALDRFKPLPQILRNIRLENGALALNGSAVEAAIADLRSKLGSQGRLIVRASGTEPLLRVMLEGESLSEITLLSNMLCAEIEAALSTDWEDRSQSEDLLSSEPPDPVWVAAGARADGSGLPPVSVFN